MNTQRLTFDEAEPERDPRCDATGEQLASVKRNDLWVQRVAGGGAKQLTHSGSETMSTGLVEFIAAEEFDRFDGCWWSRDGRRLPAFEVDEREVPPKTRMRIRADGAEVSGSPCRPPSSTWCAPAGSTTSRPGCRRSRAARPHCGWSSTPCLPMPEGKLFETVIYPGQTHGVAGQALQFHVDRTTTDFFVRHLRP